MEIPGFRRDPNTGRYYRIPLASAPPSQTMNFADTSSNTSIPPFNSKSTELKIFQGTGHCIKTNLGLPKTLALQERGLVNDFQIKMEMLTQNLRQLKLVERQSAFIELFDSSIVNIASSDYVVNIGNGNHIGTWSTTGGESSVVAEIFIFYEQLHWLKDSIPVFETYFSNFYSNLQIADICAIDIEDCLFTSVLANGIYCNTVSLIPRRCGLANLPSMREAYERRYFSFDINDVLRCCIWNKEAMSICFGTNKSLCISKIGCDSAYHTLNKFGEDVNAIECNISGNILYCALKGGTFVAHDLRDRSNSKTNFGRGITFMKLLPDDYSLITSGFDDRLQFVDMRMKKVVFNYPGHVNSHKKLPFHFDESINLICSPGQDKVTRFWSLKNGKSLASLDPPSAESKSMVHSTFQQVNGRLIAHVFSEGDVLHYNAIDGLE